MSGLYQTIGFDWRGIAVSVAYCPDWSAAWKKYQGYPLWHLEVTSEGRQPFPISETGYSSYFVSGAVIEEWGGPLPYVRHWIEAESRTIEWKNRQAQHEAAKQLSLF